MFLATKNLSSSEVEPCVPWVFTGAVPDEVRGGGNKKLRDAWINDPKTSHQCYTAFTGAVPNTRLSEARAGAEGNPPLSLSAFVADIDADVSDEELQTGIGRCNFVPNYFERTLSGNVRLIWLFEKPVSFPSNRFAIEFLKFALSRTKIEAIAPCFDKPAWETPNRLYTNSGNWKVIDADARIPAALLQGWTVEVAEKHLWKKEAGAIDIPLPIVWTEIQKKFPTATEQWPGDFVEGAQGPSFWVDGSLSPKSAIVKSTGIFTFSAHAIKPFYSWADLVGKTFAETYTAEAMGKAVANIFHCRSTYYRLDGYAGWKSFTTEDISRHLRVDRGLSAARQGDQPTEVDRALSYIQNWQGVEGAAPFAFQPGGLLVRNGLRYLNTHTRRVMQPAAGVAVWGPTGKFPTISKFFDGFFHPDSKPANPNIFFQAWMKRFYCGALELNLESGQNAVIAGAPGVGKTFLNQGLIPALMGGSAEAEEYLMGLSGFNAQLFEVAHWGVDDNSAACDATSLRKYSTMWKKMAANTSFAYHMKYQTPLQVDWRGRLVSTINTDEESSRMIPDLSISILDKISLYLTASVAPIVFPDFRGCQKIIADEGPHYAAWLVQWQPPAYTQGSARFGTVPYHEESIVRSAEQSSRTSGFQEILTEWRNNHFAESAELFWGGNTLRLLRAITSDDLLKDALRNVSAQQFSSQLASLLGKGLEWLSCDGTGLQRQWKIARPETRPATALPTGTKFQK
jgi:hypothetical protein